MQGMSNRFGRMLRAARNGFYWSQDHRCWLRVMHAEPDRIDLFQIVLVGEHADVPAMPRGKEFMVWNEGPDQGQALLRLSPALERLRLSGRVIAGVEVWVLGEDGEHVNGSEPVPG